ncbi:MAG: LPXTG cell wall anchor domain-containing protein [Clostridia bacterium]|nr:LPXTG cell wall anchor domain-containing protein [Clostridia bacterium]
MLVGLAIATGVIFLIRRKKKE